MIPDDFFKFWQHVFPFFLLFGLVFTSFLHANEVRYDSGGRRDPFMPLVAEGGLISQGFDPAGLNIEGIVFDPPFGSLVLINGEFYKQGQTVNGANVISIMKDRVILSQNDEKKTLWFREEIIRKKEVGA